MFQVRFHGREPGTLIIQDQTLLHQAELGWAATVRGRMPYRRHRDAARGDLSG